MLLLGGLLLGCGDGNGAPALAVGENGSGDRAPSGSASEARPAPTAAPASPTEEVSDPDDRAAIERAARAYVREETAVGDVRVEIEAIANGWARVRVTPEGDVTDPATMYLRKEDAGGWTVVVLGTGFAPEDYVELGIPVEVRPGS